MPTRILLIRHAESEDNLAGIIGGRRDSALTARGIQQAKAAALFLQQKGIRPAMGYSSQLLRARQTAEIIATQLNLAAPFVKRDLQERDMGILTGVLKSDANKIDTGGRILAGNRQYALAPQGAETFANLLMRAQRVLGSIVSSHPTEDVFVVTHCLTGLMMFATYYHLDWEKTLKDYHLANASLTWLDKTLDPRRATFHTP